MPEFKLSFYIWQYIVASFLMFLVWMIVYTSPQIQGKFGECDLVIKASESWFHGYHQGFWRKKKYPFTFHLSSVLTFYSANDDMNHS